MSKYFRDMSADEIAAYDGDVFNATLIWWGTDGKILRSDLESTCQAEEAEKFKASGIDGVRIQYGPIVLANGLIVERNPVTGVPNRDTPEKYTRTA